MKAAVLHELGKPPHHQDFDEPTPHDGENLIHVRAASLKPVDRQMAAGTHYASPKRLPAVCGIDGVGTLEDGSRVYFGGPRHPFGSMAERTVAPQAFCFPIPETVDDATAAALPNPGISAYLTLVHQAKLSPSESVLILGASGVTGKLATQIAKLLGASRVVAAGRNPEALKKLAALGAHATISLEQSEENVKAAFVREAGNEGFNMVIDYVWGRPTELFLSTLMQSEFAAIGSETRLIQVGESAAPTISLPAAVLRSRNISIRGTAGIPPRDALTAGMKRVLDWAANSQLTIETESIPLSQIAQAWQRTGSAARPVIVP
jgi:NADPH:quinone reductase-like Zn-dependent oxidoreductase